MLNEKLSDDGPQSDQPGVGETQIKNRLWDNRAPEAPLPTAGIPLSPANPIIGPKFFNSNINGQVFLAILTAVASLPVLGILWSSAMSPVSYNYYSSKREAAWISLFFFGGFAVSLIVKAVIQATLLSKINKISSERPTATIELLAKKYKSSYPFYMFFHLITLTGLIPFVHLLTIWLVIPIGLCILFVFAEFKFFSKINKELPENSLNLVSLRISMAAFYLFLPLLFMAIIYGIQAAF